MTADRQSIRDGFTYVELLIALAITAVLLTAVAVALNASMVNYRENEEIFRAVNLARQALSRITTQLRTAQSVDPSAPANECSLVTSTGQDITYRFDSDNNTLYLITNDDATDDDYILCENVAAMTFTKNTTTVESVVYVKSVQISITVTNDAGDFQQTVSAAVVMRRNLDY